MHARTKSAPDQLRGLLRWRRSARFELPVIRRGDATADGRREREVAYAALLLWTAMKEGLLGDRLGVSSRSEHEEARSYVARWDWI
jgi:hypothetical protein